MTNYQTGILMEPVPKHARYLYLSLSANTDYARVLQAISGISSFPRTVVGIGTQLLETYEKSIPGLTAFPRFSGANVDIPSTPRALWCWMGADDRGELIHNTLRVRSMLEPVFKIEQLVDAFQYLDNRDLSGYIDGTENPGNEEARDAAIVNGMGAGLDGSSFVAVQQWVHNLNYMSSLPQNEQDNIIGRRISDNEEIDDAPFSAHVKRTAQESFSPEAFVVRRSMPWADSSREGLIFVAFGKSFDAFEALLKRMAGVEDDIADALFQFTQPVTGSYFWCPPVIDGKLDLSALM
ncbi:MAG: Dyp-type peroxidase [Gammaproteobacteria bacterium]